MSPMSRSAGGLVVALACLGAGWIGAAAGPSDSAAWPRPAPPRVSDDLVIVHVDVGQGDATLVLGPVDATGGRVRVLVDAGDIPMGGDRDGGAIVGAVLARHGVRELDHFIATHYDADHIGGVITGRANVHGTSFLLGPDGEPGGAGDDDGDGQANWLDDRRTAPDPDELGTGDDVRVLDFIDRGDQRPPSSRTYRKYRAMAEASGSRTSITDRTAVDSLDIDLGSGASMICLAANGFVRDRAARVARVNTENERSLCFLVRHGGFHYLIGGDLIGRRFASENAEVEDAVGTFLLDHQIEIDVLHVNHHGANNGSAMTFLEAVEPEVAVISLGNANPHHHPHRDVLARLVDSGVSFIYQTEWGSTEGVVPAGVRRRQAIFQGDIELVSDGVTYTISTSRTFEADG